MIGDALRQHPGQAVTCMITGIGVLLALLLLLSAWHDWRGVRAGNGQAAFMARQNLYGELIHLAFAATLLLLSVRGLVTAVQTIDALPAPLRAAALERAKRLSVAQAELAALYGVAVLLVLLVLLDSARGLIGRRLFGRRYPKVPKLKGGDGES